MNYYLDIHDVAIRAINSMRKMSRDFDRGFIDFSEAQLHHEIANVLAKDGMWAVLEYLYPAIVKEKIQDRRRTDLRCDVVGWEGRGSGKKTGGIYHWIEVKYTGYKGAGYRNNNFGSLGYEHDFEKLQALDNRVATAYHNGYWVWLYVFETYQENIEEYLRSRNMRFHKQWDRLEIEDALEVFPLKGGQNMTLGRILDELKGHADLEISLMPDTSLTEEERPLSALLVTAIVR